MARVGWLSVCDSAMVMVLLSVSYNLRNIFKIIDNFAKTLFDTVYIIHIFEKNGLYLVHRYLSVTENKPSPYCCNRDNHHKQCIGRKYRFRTCLNRTHTNYDNIEYICQEGSTTDDDHCHIHMCLVLWTQAPLCAIVLLAFVVGAIWEIRNGIRIKPGSLAT